MRISTGVFILAFLLIFPLDSSAQNDKTVAVIGTGDMGNSLGPKLAEIGYRVVYGSRDPSRESVQALTRMTGANASATIRSISPSISTAWIPPWRPAWPTSRRGSRD